MLLQRRLSIVLYAGVLVKALLRHAIEGERGDGALQAWPHGQWEQHQPVKFSSSAQIMCRIIGTSGLWTSAEGRLPREARTAVNRGNDTDFERDVNSCLSPQTLSHGTGRWQSH